MINNNRYSVDGHSTRLCEPLPIGGTFALNDLSSVAVSREFKDNMAREAEGERVCWGMRFMVDKIHIVKDQPREFALPEVKVPWLCFLHTAEIDPSPEAALYETTLDAFQQSNQTATHYLNKLAAVYHIQYADGSEAKYDIHYRHQINTANFVWGETCFDAVAQQAPFVLTHKDDVPWGMKQHIHRNGREAHEKHMNWICAWKNPHPQKAIVGIRIEPVYGLIALYAVTGCHTQSTPIRWEARKKVLLTLPEDSRFDVDEPLVAPWVTLDYQTAYRFMSESRQQLLQLDMGTIISVVPRFAYNNHEWNDVEFDTAGTLQSNQYIVEYSAHPEAELHVAGGETIALSTLESDLSSEHLSVIPPARQTVTLRVIDQQTRRPVAVRLHVHGQNDEYLAPVNRHRIPGGAFFEDYGPELAGKDMHTSTYIDGQTILKLPIGRVYIEVSKGFECKPIHTTIDVKANTSEITLEIEKVLTWREKGWVSADTHVHFISPTTANLEGAAEGVNVVNLLASQWGELMSNVGDFDGKTTLNNREGGDNYLVRVGTENRQYVLGHISLVGYQGAMITPLCAGGPGESAIGDPAEILMTEWAQQCRKQNGLVIAPHFPEPQAEYAATIVSGLVDAVEMNGFSAGITPLSLVNWYRYLNCGYQLPLTGGTDKMFAGMEIGRIRGYSKLSDNTELTYEAWQQSIRDGNTFVTVGPLLEYSVNGHEAGSRFSINKKGGHVTVTWQAETVKYQMTGIELIVNGEIVEGKSIDKNRGAGYFDCNIERSSWICILIRGKFTEDDDERILAHSSSVMIEVQGSEFFSRLDAVSILEQIEGSVAYLDHIGTRAETRRYQQMRLILEQAHKKLHDRLHQLGFDHPHSIMHKHH